MLLAQDHISRTSLAGKLGITLAAAALIALSAKVQVPFWPVPMTLQTMAVMGLAVVLGPRLGLAAMGSYLAAGLAGLPVFATAGAGLAYLAGPTAGFLLGFLLAMGVTGALAQGRGILGRGLAMLAGLATIYVPGLIWLTNFVPSERVLAAGFTPFILGDLVKLVVALMLIEGTRRIMQRR
ncbi:MAG: biotin transporter BioY [Paracoccus sp. (in: a-proteobacteria)]|uniref:biotin transporter BioY n=1 Tax=Paracoccus sp. TaxID=267 RepID=UPI003919CCE6